MPQRTKIIRGFLEKVLVLLFIVPLTPPNGIYALSPTLAAAWNYSKYLSFIVTLLAFLVTTVYRRRIDKNCIIMLIFPIIGAVVTLINGESLDAWISRYLIIIVAALLVSVYKNSLVTFLRTTSFYLEVLLIINLFFVLRYPNGLYELQSYGNSNWFLGYKSSLQCYVLPLLCFSWINSAYGGNRLHFFFILTICFVEALICKNMMLTVGMILLLAVYVSRFYKKTEIMNGITYLIANVVINIFIIGFNQIASHFGWVQSFLIALGKTSAISGRTTVVWPKALQMIQDRLILGYGVYSGDKFTHIFGSVVMPHAHNQFLQVLLDGGLVLLFCYVIWMVFTAKELTRNKELKSSQIVALCSFTIFVMASVEIITTGIIYCSTWIMLFIGSCTKELDRQYSMALEQLNYKRRGKSQWQLN